MLVWVVVFVAVVVLGIALLLLRVCLTLCSVVVKLQWWQSLCRCLMLGLCGVSLLGLILSGMLAWTAIRLPDSGSPGSVVWRRLLTPLLTVLVPVTMFLSELRLVSYPVVAPGLYPLILGTPLTELLARVRKLMTCLGGMLNPVIILLWLASAWATAPISAIRGLISRVKLPLLAETSILQLVLWVATVRALTMLLVLMLGMCSIGTLRVLIIVTTGLIRVPRLGGAGGWPVPHLGHSVRWKPGLLVLRMKVTWLGPRWTALCSTPMMLNSVLAGLLLVPVSGGKVRKVWNRQSDLLTSISAGCVTGGLRVNLVS